MWPTNWSFSLPTWAVSNSLQKRLVKFLLRRTVGQFLKTELDDENLDVQLSGGQLRLRNVELSEEASINSTALNDAIAGLPIVVDSGAIGLISVSIPWTQLWTGHCEVQIDELSIKSRLANDNAGDELPSSGDAMSTVDKSRARPSRSTIADSIAMTEGNSSILNSSVFIADDFLRAETLGYGDKDEVFINKDVERLIATAHEERAQRQRSRGKSVRNNVASGSAHAQARPLSLAANNNDNNNDNDDDDLFEDSNDVMIPKPGSPGGTVQGLQVVSEMVDRIISAVNIRVQKVTVECIIATRDNVAGDMSNTLQLTIDSIELLDEKAGRYNSSSNDSSSGSTSSENIAGSSRDHPAGIEYKVIEFRTLNKLLEIRGLRLDILSSSARISGNSDGAATILSTFGAPISAHARIHRRMPFSELMPVQTKRSAGGHRKSETEESVYMGPMPGEFREAKPVDQSSPISPTQPADARAYNNFGEEPTTSGWDVSIDINDIACVLTSAQMERLLAMVRLAAPLIKQSMVRQAVMDQFHGRFGDQPFASAAEFFPQLARWVNVTCRHIFVAIVPEPDDTLDTWHESSLSVLRLKLESVKHLALYLKGLSAKWESTPLSGTVSAPSETAGFMDTDFWAAMTREATARTDGVRGNFTAHGKSSRSTTTLSAHLESFNIYDSSPKHHPVVIPLLSIDRSLQPDTPSQQSRSNTSRYDIWVNASDSDLALTINVAPIVIELNKELADRLSTYQELMGSIASVDTGGLSAATVHAADTGNIRDVAESIEQLMSNLKLETGTKMPSKIAVCSSLIRTWIKLPGTDVSSDSHSSKQSRPRIRAEQPAPGHFCIDAVDAVITNVINGTATSSQSPNMVPEGHMRHPHIQELLESRKSVGGSGLRVECEALHVYVQSVEGGNCIEHIASMHQPSRLLHSTAEAVSIPRPHIEITNNANPDQSIHDIEHGWHRPPAFEAFSAKNDNIRVRMAPESELTTSLEFEQLAVSSSQVVVSCHMPEADISLSRKTYQRLNAVINDFMLWQSIQEESVTEAPYFEQKRRLGLSVLIDVPLMTAGICSSEAQLNEDGASNVNIPGRSQVKEPTGFSYQSSSGLSQRCRLNNTQLFLSNSIIENGRVYVSMESNQLRLSSFLDGVETEVALSHTFANSDTPIITPQLSLFLLTSPSLSEESEAVLKTTWTTFDYRNESTCFRELEAFFSSSGTSGMVQPPPKPMRLSLNVQNSSFRWCPSTVPNMNSAAVSVDSLAVILGINSHVSERDNEELRYYIEGLSVFGRSADSQSAFPVDVSNDAWVSTGRFWKDHGYAALVHMDMIDIASRSKEGDDGPLMDLRLYSEALMVDVCADSISTLPNLAQGLLHDINGDENKNESQIPDKRRAKAPRVLGQTPDDVFGDIEEDAFANSSAFAGNAAGSSIHGVSHSQMSAASHLSSHSARSFTNDFENGRDDIGILLMDDYFATQEPPDVAEDYEVVGGKSLSPTSPKQPKYSKTYASTVTSGVPISQQMSKPSRISGASGSSRGQSLETKSSKGKEPASRVIAKSPSEADDLAFSDDNVFDFHDYVDMDSGGNTDGFSGDDSDFGPRKHKLPPYNLKLQSQFAATDSVVLEPDFPASKYISQKPSMVHPPKAEFISWQPDASNASVKITSSKDEFIDDDKQAGAKEGIEFIEDYFKAPVPGEASSTESSDSEQEGSIPILALTVDVARVEVNLHSGQDWYMSESSSAHAGDLNFMPSYMDNLDASTTNIRDSHGQTSASMPEYHGSPLFSPMSPRKQSATCPERRSPKPKIELRATQVHSEYRQYAESSTTSFDLGVNVDMLEILDRLETSEWSKLLTRRRDTKTGLPASLHLLANSRNRKLLTAGMADSDRVTNMRMRRQKSSRWAESNAEPMLSVQVEAVRPYTSLETQELRVDVEISPLRCYIHQDALDFIIGFFETAERLSTKANMSSQRQERSKWGVRSTDHPYFQIVRITPINVIFDYKPRRMRTMSGSKTQQGGSSAGTDGAPLDGELPSAPQPSSRSRKPMELLNFFPLEDAEMTLSTVKVRGVAGIAKLIRELGHAWLPHLTQTQIPGVVSGITPLRSLVNLGTGVADLVILPLEQYRKDGRLVQGFKRGAQSFAKTTALEAIHLGAKVAVNAQTLLEQAGDVLNVDIASSGDSAGSGAHSLDSRRESIVSPLGAEHHLAVDMADFPDYISLDGRSHAGSDYSVGTSSNAGARRNVFGKSKYAKQPENLGEGMRQAYASLRSNVGDAVQTILAIPVVVQEDESGQVVDGATGRSPVHGSVRAVVRAVPVAVLKPMIGATEAVSKTLLGLRNTIEPARREQLEHKYKSRSLGLKKL
ncbi:autophagy- protein 2 [Coemansia brasiliensis]|uniref:Autophagy-related protein 2 n=1 Tax=Coemansia brasiliensis TaxID=2650707 RepID=A0A9W8IAC4_9FUNG|nr:autophagy- protein 2 [Coemansia brasiliensis]